MVSEAQGSGHRCPTCGETFEFVLDFVNHTMSWVHGDPHRLRENTDAA